MVKRTEAEEEALTDMAKREIAWTLVRGRVFKWTIGGAAVLGAGLLIWREGRDLLVWVLR